MSAQIYRSGKHWVIDYVPNRAKPCCETKENAERLLALSSWEKRHVLFTLNGELTCGRVTNVGLVYGQDGSIREMLAVRNNGMTYWIPQDTVREVDE